MCLSRLWAFESLGQRYWLPVLRGGGKLEQVEMKAVSLREAGAAGRG